MLGSNVLRMSWEVACTNLLSFMMNINRPVSENVFMLFTKGTSM